MFSRLRSIESWATVARFVLVWSAVLALAPGALVTVIALGFMLIPAALVGLPFMLPALLGSANSEHAAAVRRSLHPPLRELRGLPKLTI